jgi:hypothetical protein
MYDTGGEFQTGRYNQREISYYNENNKQSEYQKPIYTEASGDPYYGILGYKEASFLKIRNISLAYTLPHKLTNKWKIGAVKLNAQAVNPGIVFRNIDWIDMDLGTSNWNRGFSFGINVEF